MQLYMITILHKVLSIVRIALKISNFIPKRLVILQSRSTMRPPFEKKYLEVIMKIESTNPISLKIFADQFLRKIPTSEAAVERVFSRHKLIHTAVRARLSPDVSVRGSFHSLQCFTSLHHTAFIRRKLLCCKLV